MAETVSLTPFQAPSIAPPPGFPGEMVVAGEFPLTFTDKAMEMVSSALAETDGEDGDRKSVV